MGSFDFFHMAPQFGKLGIGLGGAIIFGGITYSLRNCMYNIDAGHRGILFNRLTGLGETVYTEGTHFMIPWIHRPIIFDVRTRPRLLTSLTGSRDQQMVNITCRVLSRPCEQRLPTIYRNLGKDHDERVLPSLINEVLKSVIAQYNASQLITQREVVSRAIRDQLTQRAKDFNILLDDVSLTHLNFSPEYEKAVEQKQVAQQQVERAKYIVQKAIEEKKSIVIRAQGEKQAVKLIGTALKNNPDFIQLKKIEVSKEIASILAGSANKVLLDTDTLLLNLWKENNTK